MQFAGLSFEDASNMPVPKHSWVPQFSLVFNNGSTFYSFHNVTFRMFGEWLKPIPRSNFFTVQDWYLHCSLVNLTTMTGKLVHSPAVEYVKVNLELATKLMGDVERI